MSSEEGIKIMGKLDWHLKHSTETRIQLVYILISATVLGIPQQMRTFCVVQATATQYRQAVQLSVHNAP